MIRRMKFGIFLAPFHRVGDNPTLALTRDMELIEWLDHLGYDEAWIGEHHSAGWETIADPAVFIAAAAERTKHIRLGSGVVSLPYHHPLMVAQRFVLLDHMTRGRVMLGVGPGALTSDAYMMGIEPVTQRQRMDESLGAIIELLKCAEPVTIKTDWFELRDARLHLAPYTQPHFEIAVASTFTPAGMVTAGKYGVGILSIGAGLPGGADALANHWKLAEEAAAEAGHTMNRADWRLVAPVHVAEDRERALRDVREGERAHTLDYFRDTLGRPPGRDSEDPLREGVEAGTTLVGTPEDVTRGIERLIEMSGGGFGGLLFMAHEWANREATLRSYELFARHVMPRFQGQLQQVSDSREWVAANKRTIFGPSAAAIVKAFSDAGKELPAEIMERMQERQKAEEAQAAGANSTSGDD
ncbi:MAG: LLM class flavin-dependent oxidoreductase [Dehalococcoidia bacterium]